MKNSHIRTALSVASLVSLVLMSTVAKAGPVLMRDVIQVVNSNPQRISAGNYTQLRLAPQDPAAAASQDPQDPNKQSGSRVQTQEEVIITEEPCDCAPIPVETTKRAAGFPWWVLGFAAVPLVFIPGDDDKSPTPTPTGSPSMTPTTTPSITPTPSTPTPTPSLTPTPTGSPSVSPPTSPTPTPTNPVPEPMTLLLFGTGLAGLGAMARNRWRKNSSDDEEGQE